MADQNFFGYAPEEHGYKQMGSYDSRAPQDPSSQFGDQYQAFAQQNSHDVYGSDHDQSYPDVYGAGSTTCIYEDGVEQFGGTHHYDEGVLPDHYQYVQTGQYPANNGEMPTGHHQANQISGTFTPYQPQGIEASYDGTWDQSRHAEDLRWPQEGQHQHDCSNQVVVPGWQPLHPQASESMEFLNLEEPMETNCDGGTIDGAMAQGSGSTQCEQVSANHARDEDLISEASIDLEEGLDEDRTSQRHFGIPGWYNYQTTLDETQPWNPFAAISRSHPSNLDSAVIPLFDDIEVIKTEDLTDTSQDAASSYVMVNNATSASSLPAETQDMMDSTATLRQPAPQPVIHEHPVVHSDLGGMAPMLNQQGSAGTQPILDLTHLHIL